MNIGDKWGEWKIDKFIGEGSFGKVYRIVREEFGHTYESALKVIRIPQNQSEYKSVLNEGMSEDSVTSYFQGMVEDIVSEFALMSQLRGNSNIVSFEDHSVKRLEDVFGWDIFIRMELLTPLYDYLEERTLTIRDVIKMGIDICKALEVCQKYNIIHRDIKPENIFFSDLGDYKLGDFGIARQLEKTSAGLSKKGTYTYMAPEVYKEFGYNSTVDIYSLGIVLYRFLNNNRTPFMPPYPETIRYSDKENANILRMSGKEIPMPCNAEGRLGEIVLKACAYEPKDRYESAGEMRKALERIAYTEEESKIIYPAGDDLKKIRTDSLKSLTDIEEDLSESAVIVEEKDGEGTVLLFESDREARLAKERKAKKEAEERARKEAEEKARREEEARLKAIERKREEDRQAADSIIKEWESAVWGKTEGLEEIKTVIASYDMLTDDQKDFIPADVEACIEADRIEVKKLEEEIDKEKRAAERVIKKWISGPIDSDEKVNKAKRIIAEYDDLSADEKMHIPAEKKASIESGRREIFEYEREIERRAKEQEERARKEAEEKARKEAEEKARQEKEEKARKEAEEKARREAEEKARKEAEEKARREKEEKARKEAEEKKRKKAEAKKRREAKAAATKLSRQEWINNHKKDPKIWVAVFMLLAILGGGGYGYSYMNHEVPDITGVSVSAAKETLREDGFKYEEGGREFSDKVKRNIIIDQDVKSGEKVKKGTVVTVIVSKGKPIDVPSISGLSYEKAEAILKEVGLMSKIEKEQFHDTIKKNYIISQKPEKGTKCEEGTKVSVILSKGITQVKVPKLKGMKKKKAGRALKKAGLKMKTKKEYSNKVKKGFVIKQSIKPGKKVDKFTKVTVTVSLGAEPVYVPEPSYSGDYSGGSGSGGGSKNSNKKSGDGEKESSDDGWIKLN